MKERAVENINDTNLVAQQSSGPSAQGQGKPANLPPKFWDASTQTVKLQELIDDYNSMAIRDENLVGRNT